MTEKTSAMTGFENLFSDFTPLRIPKRIAASAWTTHIPFAFWLVESAAPRLVVELGTYAGASFCAFCQQIAHADMNAMCYAVDTWKGDSQAGFYDDTLYADLSRHVHTHYAPFAHLIRSTFDDALPLFRDDSIDLLHIDGYHSYEAMMHDFESWLPKMSARGVILMHDINARIEGYGGLRAWDDIAARFPTFAFEHGFGLGVVLAGNEPPEKLRLFVECGRNPAFAEKIRRYFSLIGALQQTILELTLDGNDAHRALDEERNASVTQRQALERELENTRHAAESLLRQYVDSRSWRLTKPLRLAANCWRRLRGLPPNPELPRHFTMPDTPDKPTLSRP